ncbi:outer membrane assembly lipoYfiO family protein [Neorickettsia helminthoeca str. Oregon]|uniref:Outer membrane assembly lipoYfiO family protein n=1 Tax=Neorickettsia helminthoeca str. Oregon TaxID=1286528 RepID=X5HL19_9RICK|nr:outer membrane protein assembly factor BamD [Neorickettsia helminthoeca]AHX11799.1 outer membrane assembly lipoYfiO family protein [Neorickettsia helminthoeca str. Oregon]
MRRKICDFLLLLLCSLLVVSGCTPGKVKGISEKGKQASELSVYNDAVSALKQGKLKISKALFRELSDVSPFSPLGEKAKCFYTELLYDGKDFAAAAGSADEYILNYPVGKDLDYMLSIKGNAYFRMLRNFANSTEFLDRAKDTFKELIRRFPGSKYVSDAREKLREIDEILAEKIFSIGMFYFKEMNYHAAISRFTELINGYPKTKCYSEALSKRREAYKALGIDITSSQFTFVY